MQIKSYFYNVLLRQLSFPANIGQYINSLSNLVFVYHNIICEKPSAYYVFLLLECKRIYMEIAQNMLTSSVSKMNSNKNFLLERLIEKAALSSKYWKLHQFSKKLCFRSS